MLFWLRFLAFLLLGSAFAPPLAAREAVQAVVSVVELPPEARHTLTLIKRGGPFPYSKDGSVFGNFERRLPLKPRGYYREYTVNTPGRRDRGPRRIISGGELRSPVEFYYTDDHYQTFRRILE